MGKNSNSSLLSSFSDIFSTQEMKQRKADKENIKQRKDKGNQNDMLGSGSDITFGTILEDDYQDMHAEADKLRSNDSTKASLKKKKKKKKKTRNSLLATFSDIFSTSNTLDDTASMQSEAQSRAGGKKFRDEIRRESEVSDAKVLLEMERERRIQAEGQIQTIMEMNHIPLENGKKSEENHILSLHRQLLGYKLKLNREEKNRLEAERREYEAQSELEMCHSALLAAQQDKAHLEAELMEAAADVLEQQALQNACKEMQRAYQDLLQKEKEFFAALERHQKEVSALQNRLKASDVEKLHLINEVARLKAESNQWEEALDRLQAQVDRVLLQNHSEGLSRRGSIANIAKASINDVPITASAGNAPQETQQIQERQQSQENRQLQEDSKVGQGLVTTVLYED